MHHACIVGDSVLKLKCVCVCCLGVVHAPVQSTCCMFFTPMCYSLLTDSDPELYFKCLQMKLQL